MKKVILIDDSNIIHTDVQMLFNEYIEKKSLELKSYFDPFLLLQNLEHEIEDFDLLIVDINMPEMSGLDLIKRVRELSKFQKKPIFVLTTETDTTLIEKAKEVKATAWFVKSKNQAKLLKAVVSQLGLE